MPESCAAYNCKNQRRNGEGSKSKSFFSFPLHDLELMEEWNKALGRTDFQVTKYSKICEDHFLQSDFLTKPGAKRKILFPKKVPSIFDFSSPKGRKRCDSERVRIYDILTIIEL